MMKAPWEALHQALDQLKTDEGARAFYAANPGLAGRYATEAAFLEAVRGWRPKLEKVPRALPDLQANAMNFHRGFDGSTLAFRAPDGPRVEITWEGGGKQLGRVTDLTVE
jgi:hypothetical protein